MLARTTDLPRLGFTYRSGLFLADVVGSWLSVLCRRRVLNELQDCPTLSVGPQGNVSSLKFFGPTIMPSCQLEDGRFRLALQPGDHRLEIAAPGFTPLHVTVPVTADSEVSFELQPNAQVTVHAEAETLSPDPSARVIFRDDAVVANPGRPGVPISIPGYPAETASGGIKAPQYFAP